MFDPGSEFLIVVVVDLLGGFIEEQRLSVWSTDLLQCKLIF
jgi:hypothetical protein